MGSGYQGEGMKCILPHSARCKLEFFLAPDQDPDQVFSHIRNHFISHGFNEVVLNPFTKLPPSRTKPTAGFAQITAKVANEIYEDGTVIYPIMPGFNPMGHFTRRFSVPAVSLGVGNANSRIHQPNENVRIEDFLQGIKLIAALIDRLGQSTQSWN
jgi:acetylornithine deacetylase/succinyl-diaminopimelate desuccinylase-like protein